MLYGVLRDPVLLNCLEADFFEYYRFDIYSFMRGEVSCRRMINLIVQLPTESRFSRRVRNDPLKPTEHLLLNVVDAVRVSAYHGYYAAAGQIGKKYKEIGKKAPKPIPRPQYDDDYAKEHHKENKVKPKFLTGRELKAMMGQVTTKRVVAHTQACIAAGTSVTEGVGLQCNCPIQDAKA